MPVDGSTIVADAAPAAWLGALSPPRSSRRREARGARRTCVRLPCWKGSARPRHTECIHLALHGPDVDASVRHAGRTINGAVRPVAVEAGTVRRTAGPQGGGPP